MTRNIHPFLYDIAYQAAAHARRRDYDFFAQHPRQVCRVRSLFHGERPLAIGLQAQAFRAYVIITDHTRAGDRHAKSHRGLYSIVARHGGKDEAWFQLSQEAVCWAKWFRRHSTTPPPRSGASTVVGGAG